MPQEPCQLVFVRVNWALCGKLLLYITNFSLPFILQTDASNSGLGAVLSQEVEGIDRPILYISRKLAQREVNYSMVEKDCLAWWAVGARVTAVHLYLLMFAWCHAFLLLNEQWAVRFTSIKIQKHKNVLILPSPTSSFDTNLKNGLHTHLLSFHLWIAFSYFSVWTTSRNGWIHIWCSGSRLV